MLPEITAKILLFLQEEAITQFPAFPEAFGQLIPAHIPASFSNSLSGHSQPAFGTDGEHLYTDSSRLQHLFLTDTDKLKKNYLHAHLHCLCLHVIQPDSVKNADWDLACDLSVDLLADILQNKRKNSLYHETEQLLHNRIQDFRLHPDKCDSSVREKLSQAHQQLKRTGWLTAEMILLLFPDIPDLRQIAGTCALDSHCFWHRPDPSLSYTESTSVSPDCPRSSEGLPSEKLQKLEQILQRWNHRLPKLQPAGGSGQRGKTPGSAVEEAELRRRDTMDYHRFLRQFAVAREEAILDMDAFDYIPYYYGLACYGNEISSYTGQDSAVRSIPFLEPLEYKEVNRLDEFAIAIDTSASCSGIIVRRFLEETWSILRQRENFFSKIRIHLIQCDSMIQDHQIFTSSEQLEQAMETIKIQGLGNTDFRPVFEYLEKLIQNKEIRHLRGLLYFTDGDGIFPSRAPDWDTAFVFLNRETEKHAIPDWGIRLNLHIPDLEIAPIRERI